MVINLSDKKFFIKSSYADDWTRWIRERNRSTDYELRFFNLIKAKHNEIIVEIGSGEGRIAKKLLEYPIYYIGVDISQKILVYAKTELEKLFNSGFYFIEADAEFLPFKRAINKVFFLNSLFFVPNRFKALNNTRNILKENGKLLLDNSNVLNLYYILYFLYGKVRQFAKIIANHVGLIRKLIRIVRKRDYNPYFRPGSKGNFFIYNWELKRLNFRNIRYIGELTSLQKYFLKLIPNTRIQQLIYDKFLKFFSARLIIEAQVE
jgi:ubiquinone/menaquinone biosynthesis C-methylase UbiE